MERTVKLTHSADKFDAFVGALGYSDYKACYDKDCEARGFKTRFADKFGEGVYAVYDQSGTASNWTPVFEWLD